MKKIVISGEIGWDVDAWTVQQQVNGAAKNEDLEVFLSSPGGSVFEGIDIADIFKNYKRDNPGAQLILHMGAISASMGSFIPATKAFDLVTAEDTTSHMRHNPIMGTFGDYREMDSSRKFLEGLTNISAKIYSGRSGQAISKERKDMDSETWLFGEEIVKAGFADEIIKSESPESKETLFPLAKMRFKEVRAKVLKTEIEPEEFSRVAAIVKSYEPKTDKTVDPTKPTPENTSIKPAPGGENNQEDITVKDSNELKEKFPEIHAETMKAGSDREKTARTERVKALLEMKAKEDFKNIPDALDRIDEGILKDESVQAVELGLFAILRSPGVKAAMDSADIGEINPGVVNTVSGEKGKAKSEAGEF